MTNFLAVSPDMQQQRDIDYAVMGVHAAACLAESLDYIIDNSQRGRSAAYGAAQDSEWYESEVLLGAVRRPPDGQDWAWPPSTLRIQVRRDTLKTGDQPGDKYTVLLEWLTHRGDLEDPGFTRAYLLKVPKGTGAPAPELLLCYQPSVVKEATDGQPPKIDNIVSLHPEADIQLNTDFYNWEQGTEYDAEKLFDELSVLVDAAVHQAPYVWDAARFIDEAPAALPRITHLPQGLLADVLEQM